MRSPFLPDAPQTQILAELAPTEREAVLDKLTFSAFAGTWLELALRGCDLDAVAVVGVATEIGIEPTVRHAGDLGFVPVVITDACAAGDPVAGERSIQTLRFLGDALLTDVAGFRRRRCRALAGSGSAPRQCARGPATQSYRSSNQGSAGSGHLCTQHRQQPVISRAFLRGRPLHPAGRPTPPGAPRPRDASLASSSVPLGDLSTAATSVEGSNPFLSVGHEVFALRDFRAPSLPAPSGAA